jgi:type II secretory pathway pseudopilin PulG
MLATALPPWLLVVLCLGIAANAAAQVALWWIARSRVARRRTER